MDEELKKHVLKTGTTTIGIVCKEGVVIAADKRASFGGEGGVAYIAGSDQKKIEEVTPNIIVTTAGVASDTRRVIKLVRAELKLKELKSRSKPTVRQAANLFSTMAYQNIRQPSIIPAITHFLLAGYDDEGFYLFDISPDGFLKEKCEYSATGSGMMQCNPILDSEYKDDLTLEQGIKLARKCINASLKRDPASGDGIDIYTVTKDKIEKIATEKFQVIKK